MPHHLQSDLAGHMSDSKSNRLERLLTVKQLQINSLLEVSQAINNNFSTTALFRIYEFILRAQMGIQSLLVFVKQEDWDCVTTTADPEFVSNISVNEDLGNYKIISRINHLRNPKLSGFDIIIPVQHKDEALAYVLIGELKTDDNDSIEEKIKFIQTITNIVIVAMENKKLFNNLVGQEVMKKELELAARMQSMLIPQTLPMDERKELAAVYLPHQDVGGDYYDYLYLSENEVAFCVGDISGKGMAAALLMANFQANLRSLINASGPLDNFIEILNDKVNAITHGEKFITLFLGVYNLETRELLYVNSGHNPSLLYNGEGEILQLELGSTLLGMFEKLPFVNVGRVKLNPGAVIMNYTDGLVDFENEEGEFFDIERVLDFFKENKDLSMVDFNEKLLQYVEDFKGESVFTDDITILSCRFL